MQDNPVVNPEDRLTPSTSWTDQPGYKRVYVLPAGQQNLCAKVALFLLGAAFTCVIGSAIWPNWGSGRRRESDGKVVHFRLTGTLVCARENASVGEACRSYAQEFGDMPSQVKILWAGYILLIVSSGLGIGAIGMFLWKKSSKATFLEAANYHPVLSAFALVPILPYKTWVDDYCTWDCSHPEALYGYEAALVVMALAIFVTMMATRKKMVKIRMEELLPPAPPRTSAGKFLRKRTKSLRKKLSFWKRKTRKVRPATDLKADKTPKSSDTTGHSPKRGDQGKAAN